jgi:hypothetical protein
MVRLEVPPKPFSDIITSDAFRLYGIEELQPFSDPGAMALTSKELQALDDSYTQH